jgi:hypothetical protein
MIGVPAVVLAALVSAAAPQRAGGSPAPGGPALFETAFIDGTRAKASGRDATFTRKRLGALEVTSGRIAAFDPLVEDAPEPFVTAFPKGAFAVELAVARIGDDERIAFARVVFSDRPVARWELALLKGQDPADLGPDEFFGYGVDSGTGAFMDAEAAKALAAGLRADDALSDRIVTRMDEVSRTTWSAVLWDLGGRNAALFSSGWGDGFYASYVGYDAKGRVVRLLTDFGVADRGAAGRR